MSASVSSAVDSGAHRRRTVTTDRPSGTLFDRVGLVGRDKEVRILKSVVLGRRRSKKDVGPAVQLPRTLRNPKGEDIHDDSADPSTSSNVSSSSDSSLSSASSSLSRDESHRTLVLVSGQSGSGKSAVVARVRAIALDECTQDDSRTDGDFKKRRFQGFFASGKCSLVSAKEGMPFAGIRGAMMELCQQIRDRRLDSGCPTVPKPYGELNGTTPSSSMTLQERFSEELDDVELQLLSNVIPSIRTVTGTRSPQRQRQQASTSVASHLDSGSVSSDDDCSSEDAGDYQKHTDRLKFVLRRFMQVICSQHPVVLAIDDLQWADQASLDLIHTWLLDSRNTSLTIIGSYRSNMLDENQRLKSALVSLEEFKRERSIRIVRIPIEDFGLQQVAEYLARLFLPDEPSSATFPTLDDIDALARLVHARTEGNAFFVRQLVETLVENGLIVDKSHSTCNPSTQGGSESDWYWNIDDMNSDMASTAGSVMDLMQDKLNRVSSARIVLPIAACLGATFSLSHVCTAVRGLSIHSEHSKFFRRVAGASRFLSNKDIAAMLSQCRQEGLIDSVDDLLTSSDESVSLSATTRIDVSHSAGNKNAPFAAKKRRGTVKLCFSHDKFQEAALSLIPSRDDLSELRFRVGEILMHGLSSRELDNNVFNVANLLNTRSDLACANKREDVRLKIANLNHRAGRKAAQYSAFHLSSMYFRKAIELLPRDHWKTSLKLCIDLYSSAAESSYVIGDCKKALAYCSAVIDQDCDILRKIRAYHVLTDLCKTEAIRYRGMSAMDIMLDLLSQLGCRFPATNVGRTVATIKGLLRAKRASKKLGSGSINGLQVAKDKHHLVILESLAKAISIAYLLKPELLPLLALKGTKRTMENGIAPYSGSAFGLQGTILQVVLGDYESNQKYTQLSLGMVKLFDDRALRGKALFSATVFQRHWTSNIEDCAEPLLEVYHLGMTSGDVENGIWSISVYILILFIAGKPLKLIDDELAVNTKAAQDFRQHPQYYLISALWQTVLNLRGSSSCTTQLIGDAYDERAKEYETNPEMALTQHLAAEGDRLRLCAVFGEYELGAKGMLEYYSLWSETTPGFPTISPQLLCGGLCCLAAASSTSSTRDRKKYAKMGRKCLRQLKQWAKQGHPNCPHYIALLQAEDCVLRGKYADAHGHFQKSIDLAANRRFVHDEAIANERYSLLWASQGNKKKTSQHLNEAVRLYREWGADKKVKMLLAQSS